MHFNKRMNKILENNNNDRLNMIENDEYFIWLNEYSMKNTKIFSGISVYSTSSIEDYNNIQKLKNLFELIDEYAMLNNVKAIECNSNIYYFLSVLGINYQIGYGLIKNNIGYSCMKLPNECNIDLIDINDIRKTFYDNKKIK